VPWPHDALLSVAKTFFDKVHDIEDEHKEALSSLCVEIHMSVNVMAERYILYVVILIFDRVEYLFCLIRVEYLMVCLVFNRSLSLIIGVTLIDFLKLYNDSF